MKTKVLILSMFLFFGLSFLSLKHANAQELLWANCNVDRVLQSSSACQVRLTEVNGVFENRLFAFDNEKVNAQLAIFLTAISLNKQVRIAFSDGPPYIIELVGIIQ